MFSEPATGERFFGRAEVLEHLTRRASALKEGYRQNIAITGSSLSGKTSLIQHFLQSVRDEGFVPIYVEVRREPFRIFANKFIATMLYNILSRTTEQPPLELDRLLEAASRHLPKTSAAIRQINSLIEKGDTEEAYSNLLVLTSVLKEESRSPCIVIFDEFDNLELLGIRNPFVSFGKVIMVQKDTMYIVSSSRSSAINKILSEKLTLLFGNFEIIKVAGFDNGDSAHFIDSKLAGFDIDQSLKKVIIAITDSNPFYMDKLLTEIKNRAIEKMSSHIDADVICDAIYETIYNSTGIIHQYLMNYLLDLIDTRSKDALISGLIAIARGKNRQADISRALKLKSTEATKAIAGLVDAGLIAKSGSRFLLEDAMLEFWLARVYSRRAELLVDGVIDKVSIFKSEISAYIASYAHELDREPVARCAELFDLFSGDLHRIGSKQIRLPHFTKIEIGQFSGGDKYIFATLRGKAWITKVCNKPATENDIISFIKGIKDRDLSVAHKIIVPLAGMDENAKLLAKELKFMIWDIEIVNSLMRIYGKKKIVITG